MKLDSLKRQPSSDIMKAIVAANPNSTKRDVLTNSKGPLDLVPQEDFAYGRSRAANIQAELQAASAQALRKLKEEQATLKAVREQLNGERSASEQDASEQASRSASWESKQEQYDNALAAQAGWDQRDREAATQAASQQPGTAAPKPNASVDDKTSNNQNGSNSIAASLNSNPGYLMPTAIGQTLIAALLGRLLGGNTGMGLGAIMGLLASPLTASYLARNNYLSDIAKPFAETEKGWFSNSK